MKSLKVYEWSWSLVVLTTICLPKLLPLSIIIVVLSYAFLGAKKELTFAKPSWVTVGLIAMFGLYIFSALNSEQLDLGLKALERKAVLFIFPMLFLVTPKRKVKWEIIEQIFIGSTLLLGLIQFASASLNYNGVSSILSSNFSTLHHPTYYSIYAYFAMILLVFKGSNYVISRGIIFLLITVFIVFQAMTLSLAGFLILGLTLMLLVGAKLYQRLNRIVFWSLLVVSPFLFYFVASNTPGIADQFKTSKDYFTEYIKDPVGFVEGKQTRYLGGNETRLIVWTASYRLMNKHPFGVGMGDFDSYMSNELTELKQSSLGTRNYNSHNQFLQTGVELGYPGLVLLLALLVGLIIVALKHRNYILFFLVLNLVFNSLFESMLQRQSGIVFYAFWICLLVLSTQLSSSDKKELA